MTGEMRAADVTREAYPMHFAIADRLGGSVEPFDVYQGPYVLVGEDVRFGAEPYAVAPRGLGVCRLWLCSDDDGGFVQVYNERNDAVSRWFSWDDSEAAIDAALSVI